MPNLEHSLELESLTISQYTTNGFALIFNYINISKGSISRTFSKGPADGRPRLPIPNRQTIQYPKAEREEMEHCQMVLPPCQPKVRFGSGSGSYVEASQVKQPP